MSASVPQIGDELKTLRPTVTENRNRSTPVFFTIHGPSPLAPNIPVGNAIPKAPASRRTTAFKCYKTATADCSSTLPLAPVECIGAGPIARIDCNDAHLP